MTDCVDLPRIKAVRAYIKQVAAGDQGTIQLLPYASVLFQSTN